MNSGQICWSTSRCVDTIIAIIIIIKMTKPLRTFSVPGPGCGINVLYHIKSHPPKKPHEVNKILLFPFYRCKLNLERLNHIFGSTQPVRLFEKHLNPD
jgi:hypothetical protein